MALRFKANTQEQSLADLIEQWGAEMGARYEAAELTMIERVAKYAARDMNVPADMLNRMRVLDQLRQEGARIAAELRDPVFVQQIVDVAAREGEAAAVARLGHAAPTAGSGITPTAVQATAQIAADLTNRLDVMQSRITRWMPDAYQRVISMVTPNVTLGIQTIQQSQRQAAQMFLARGVTGFTDQSGAQWRIGSYSEMATRTSVNRAWQEANVYALGQANINLVTIVAAVDCCKFCADASGKVYSTDGTPGGIYTLADTLDPGKTHQVSVAGTLDEARSRGWNHPNCRCVVVGYFAGLSIPSGGAHDPAREKARDQLRSLERQKRDLKRREAASFDDITKQQLRGRVRGLDARIRQHVADTGVTRKPYREQLGFADGKQGLAPVTGPRPVNPVAPATKPKATPSMTEPLAPVTPSAEERRFAVARQMVSDAKTAAEAGAAIEHIGYKAINWTRGTSTETAKEIASTIVNLTEKYPIKLLQSVEMKSLSSKGVIARTSTAYKANDFRNQNPLRITFEVSTRYAGAQNRTKMLADLQNETAIGNFMPHPDAQQMQYAITHEYGHAMAGTIPGNGIPGPELRDMIQKYGRETSGYGASEYGEMIAEGFADVEFNGANAKDLSKAIHARLIEGWKANQ